MWNHTGATYHLRTSGMGTSNHFEYRRLTIDKDTIVNGKAFKQYSEHLIIYDDNGSNAPDSSYFDTIVKPATVAFCEEDSVVYGYNIPYPNGVTTMLYNFKAKIGDQWYWEQFSIDTINNPLAYHYYCDSLITITVLDTGHTYYQGTNLYFLFVKYSGLKFWDGTGFTVATDTIFERFGSKKLNLFAIYNYCMAGSGMYDIVPYWLSCYNDNEISYGSKCDWLPIYAGTNKVQKEAVSIYPNPVDDFIQIQGDDLGVIITDLTGKLIVKFYLSSTPAVVSTLGLNNGMYLVHFSNGMKRKLFVIHK